MTSIEPQQSTPAFRWSGDTTIVDSNDGRICLRDYLPTEPRLLDAAINRTTPFTMGTVVELCFAAELFAAQLRVLAAEKRPLSWINGTIGKQIEAAFELPNSLSNALENYTELLIRREAGWYLTAQTAAGQWQAIAVPGGIGGSLWVKVPAQIIEELLQRHPVEAELDPDGLEDRIEEGHRTGNMPPQGEVYRFGVRGSTTIHDCAGRSVNLDIVHDDDVDGYIPLHRDAILTEINAGSWKAADLTELLDRARRLLRGLAEAHELEYQIVFRHYAEPLQFTLPFTQEFANQGHDFDRRALRLFFTAVGNSVDGYRLGYIDPVGEMVPIEI